MDPRISVVTLGVDDVDRAVSFYRDLGFPLQDREEGSDIAFFETEGVWLALYPRDALAEDATVAPEGGGFSGVTLAQNVESETAVDALLAEAVDAGAELVKPGQETFWGGYSGYFADPDGHLWEVVWNPSFPLDAESAE
jgi:hypothetical protein